MHNLRGHAAYIVCASSEQMLESSYVEKVSEQSLNSMSCVVVAIVGI